MRNQQRQSLCSLAALAAGLLLLHATAAEIPEQVSRPDGKSADQTRKLKVFILAGQSNMEGPASIKTFDYIGDDPVTAPLCGKMRGAEGKPTVCDGAWISYLTGAGKKNFEIAGKLTAGYGSMWGPDPTRPGDKIGPEFTFGLTMDAALAKPVLIIKTAWGGKSAVGSWGHTFALPDGRLQGYGMMNAPGLPLTVAAITGVELPHHTAEDSFNLLPALEGKATAPIRPYLLTQAFGGAGTLSIRRGNWKFVNHRGSGGNRYDKGEMKPYALPESDPEAPGQLYDLATDPGEKTNLYSQKPEIVKELKALLDQSQASGRSRP